MCTRQIARLLISTWNVRNMTNTFTTCVVKTINYSGYLISRVVRRIFYAFIICQSNYGYTRDIDSVPTSRRWFNDEIAYFYWVVCPLCSSVVMSYFKPSKRRVCNYLSVPQGVALLYHFYIFQHFKYFKNILKSKYGR